jgi:hypothetical protein
MAAAGYTYGIEGVSKNSTAANFVINQGSDAKILIEVTDLSGNITVAAPLIGVQGALLQVDANIINLNGTVNVATLYAQSIFLKRLSVASAAATTVADFNTAYFLAAFPSGSYCYVEIGDGVGSSVSGYFQVGAAGALSALHQTQGALLAPVTAAALSIATSILTVTFTGKAATTNAIVRLTRCAV